MAYPKLFTLIDAIELKQINTLRKHILSKVSEESEAYNILESIIKTKDKREKYSDAEDLQLSNFPKVKIKTFINYLSMLYGYAEEWIALTQMEIDEYAKDLLVQKWLNNNGLYSLSDQLVKKVLKKIESSEGLDINDAKVKAEMLYEHLFSSNPAKYELNADDYINLINSFDEYATTFYYLLITELNNLGNKINKNFDDKIVSIILKLEYATISPLVSSANSIYKLVKNNDLNEFFRLKEQLLSGSIKKGSRLHYTVCTYLIQRSVTFTSKGLITEKKLIFDLTKHGLENGIFFDNGKLPLSTFHNLVIRLSFSSTFLEVENFILSYINRVNTNNFEATFSLASAQNCLYNHKYEEVYKLAWRGDYESFNQKILAQGLLLIVSFMHRKKDVESYKQTFKVTATLIERNKNKLSDHNRLSYINLLKFIKDLEKDEVQKLNLLNYLPVHHRLWCEHIIENS